MTMVEAEAAEDLFETTQTVCAAYLKHVGHEVDSVEWENLTGTFLFKRTAELATDFALFVEGKARVEPSAFAVSFRECTGMVRNARDREKRRLGLRDDQRLEDHGT